MPKEYFDTIEIIDRLIRKKGTGSPRQLANRLDISERTLYTYIALMKDLGAPIVYCRHRQSYLYEMLGGFDFKFQIQGGGVKIS